MAENTEMNDQVTDSVAQSNLQVLGSAPALAAGQGSQSLVHSTGLSFLTAVATQQQATLLGNSEAALGTLHLLTLGTVQSGAAPALLQPRRQGRRPGRRTGSRS